MRGWNLKELQEVAAASEKLTAATSSIRAKQREPEVNSNIPTLQSLFQLGFQEGVCLQKSRLDAIQLATCEQKDRQIKAEVCSVLDSIVDRIEVMKTDHIYSYENEEKLISPVTISLEIESQIDTQKCHTEIENEADRLMEQLQSKQLTCVDWLYLQATTPLAIADDKAALMTRSNDRVAFIDKSASSVSNKKDPFVIKIVTETFSLFGDATQAFMNQRLVFEQQGMNISIHSFISICTILLIYFAILFGDPNSFRKEGATKTKARSDNGSKSRGEASVQ